MTKRTVGIASRIVLGGAFLLTGLIAACNLSDDDYYGFGGTGGGSTGAVPTATGVPEQPSPCSSAREGYACNYGGPSVCERGTYPNASCNELLKCGGYEWERDRAKVRNDVECGQACPQGPEGPVACDSTRKALICEFQESTCGCGRPRAKKPDAGKADGSAEGGADAGAFDASPMSDGGDGGDAEAPGTYVWTCVDPGPGCPRVRPRIGAPCVKPIACDYGACTFDDGLAVRCSGGYWLKDNSVYCPP